MSIDAGPWTSQGAVFSDCFLYRYKLWREWDPKLPSCTFVMLNPSVANAVKLDPTVRRCIGFARDWGFGRLDVVNAFAWVDGKPEGLKTATSDFRMYGEGYGEGRVKDPVGPDNDAAIVEACERAECVIAAWSCWVEDLGRLAPLLELMAPFRDKLFALGYTQDGTPRHPLYLPKTAERVQYAHPSWHRVADGPCYCGFPSRQTVHVHSLESAGNICLGCQEEILVGDERAKKNWSWHAWCWIDV